MGISLREVVDLFRKSKSKSEFQLRCSVLGLNPEDLMRVLNKLTKETWEGQWLDGQDSRVVSLDEFFEMKRILGNRPEGSWMSDICKQMCYLAG